MKMNRARVTLLLIFLGALAVQIVVLLAVQDVIWPEELTAIIVKLLALYSIHLSVIIGTMFAHRKKRVPAPPRTMVWTAILLSLLWNGLMGYRVVLFSRTHDMVSDLVQYLDAVSAASSFLVVGVLAYFFASGEDPAAGAAAHHAAPPAGATQRAD